MKQQYQIVTKKVLTPEISQISVHAPLVAAKAACGDAIDASKYRRPSERLLRGRNFFCNMSQRVKI